jgi:hypothetical protein
MQEGPLPLSEAQRPCLGYVLTTALRAEAGII